MSASQDCIFCKIISGGIPCYKLYEDDATFAFTDINPANDGHALVIPKDHSKDVHAVSDDSISWTVITAKKIAAAVEKSVSPGGINLVQCNGPAAAQSVEHFHMHVIPRAMDDGMTMNWELVAGDKDELNAVGERIRAALAEDVGA